MNRTKFIGLILSAIFFIYSAPVHAQRPNKVPRIGYLAASTPAAHATRVAALRQGLKELGYLDGQNIAIEFRYGTGDTDRLFELAAELVRLNVDAIVTSGTEGAVAAKKATRTVPIVMATGDDPVAQGLVASLAKPGGNVTGLTTDAGELSGKRLELIKQLIPAVTIVGVIWSPRDPGAAANFKESETAAAMIGLRVQSLEIHSATELESVFKTASDRHVQALSVLSSGIVNTEGKRIVELAITKRLPSMFTQVVHVNSGGLVFYGPNVAEQYRCAAYYVDKILKGTKPADLPVEQPTKFELVINLKTAKQIGLTIPPNVLARADRVIK